MGTPNPFLKEVSVVVPLPTLTPSSVTRSLQVLGSTDMTSHTQKLHIRNLNPVSLIDLSW